MTEFVYIIESPSDEDLYCHKYESDLLRISAELNNMKCFIRIAASKEMFEKAISSGLKEAVVANYQQDPILHISAHGCEDGFRLTNKDFITWDDLRNLLLPISRYRNYGLLLCMSTCKGINAIKSALSEKLDNQEAVYAVVGNSGKPTWSETAVAYASFYHLLLKGSMLGDAVKAMRIASGNKDFQISLSLDEREKNRPNKIYEVPNSPSKSL